MGVQRIVLLTVLISILLPTVHPCGTHLKGIFKKWTSSDNLSASESNTSNKDFNGNQPSYQNKEPKKVTFSEDVTGGLHKKKIKRARKTPKTVEKLVWEPTSFVNGVYQNEMSWDDNINLLLSPAALEITFAALCYTSSNNKASFKLLQFLRLPVQSVGLFGSLDQKAIKGRYKEIHNTLTRDSVKLQTHFYIDESFYLKFGVEEELKSNFGLDLKTVSFKKRPEDARTTINKFFGTSSSIQNLLTDGSTNSKTTLVTANTIIFQGLWTKPFNPENTINEPFRTSSSQVIVPFMKQAERFTVIRAQDELYKVLELPFVVANSNNKERFSFLLFLPQRGQSLQDLENHLATKSWMDDLRSTDQESAVKMNIVNLAIPRFSFSYTWNFKDLLTEVTMVKSHKVSLRLSSLTFQPKTLVISSIHQAVRITVDEKGISSHWTDLEDNRIGLETRRPLPQSSTNDESFKANQPFMFAVVHQEKKIILLQGHVASPVIS